MMNLRIERQLGLVLWWVFLLQILAPSGRAQEMGEKYFLRDRAAQYYLGRKDEVLIKVNVWGFVQKPDQYLVPKDTDLERYVTVTSEVMLTV